jgi:perosamine synthetase
MEERLILECIIKESDALKGEVLRGGPETIESLADEWRQLCDEADNDLPFSRPEWVDSYFRCNTGTWVVFTLRRGKRLVALLPLIEKRVYICHIPARVLRAPSDFHLWPFDIPVAQDMDKLSVARKLWQLVQDFRGWDIFELPNVPQGGFAEDLYKAALGDGLQVHRWEYMHSPCVVLEKLGGVKDPLDLVRSKNLRANIRKALRRIQQEGEMKITFSDSPQQDILNRLYELENESWKGREGNPIAARQKDIDFWNKVTASGATFEYLSICSISLNNRIVAVVIGFNYKMNYFAIKMGWDENLKSFSLGHLLVFAILGKCINNGIKTLSLGGLRSAWKEQWTDYSIPHASHYIFRNTLYGKALRWAKLRQIARLEASFPQNRGCLENSRTKTKSSRVFFASAFPGLRLRNFVLKGGALNHFPFNECSMEYFYNARSAIFTLADVFSLRGEEVLFPSYCCGVDLEALLAAGVVPKFYPVREDMQIDASEITSRMGPATKAVYLIHYLGFPSPVEELAAICRERGVPLIEDCALALFSRLGERPLGSFGDAAVFSLYKSLPVPSGGGLVFNDGMPHILPPRYSPPFRSTMAHLRLSLQRTLEASGNVWGQKALATARAVLRTVRPSVAEMPVVEVMVDTFDTAVCRFRMSRVSHRIVRSIDPTHVVERRRENFIALNAALKGVVQPVFDYLPVGVCPLFYPIKVHDNRAMMTALRLKGVEAWAWWYTTHPKLEEAQCAEAQELRKRVVVIPCHEGISPEGMFQIVDAVTDALKKNSNQTITAFCLGDSVKRMGDLL